MNTPFADLRHERKLLLETLVHVSTGRKAIDEALPALARLCQNTHTVLIEAWSERQVCFETEKHMVASKGSVYQKYDDAVKIIISLHGQYVLNRVTCKPQLHDLLEMGDDILYQNFV